MRNTKKASTNINVEMPEEFYEEFIAKEKALGYGCHLSFLQGMVRGNTDLCWIQLLDVDGDDPTKHAVQLLHGEALYSIQNGQYHLVGERIGDGLKR